MDSNTRETRGAGDGTGRRLARRRSVELAEAGRIVQVLENLLHRADFDLEACKALKAAIVQQEQSELLKAHGRVESRRRFKSKSGQPLHEKRETHLLFIDESGRSEPRFPDPWFTVGGIAMTRSEADEYVIRADSLKLDFFGRTDFTFHEPKMRNHEELYSFGGDETRRREYCEALDKLVEECSFVAFGVGIRKNAFMEFMAQGQDPYLPFDVYAVAIHMLLERYVDFLATASLPYFARVAFESQGPREDAEHQREFSELLINGTQWVPGTAFRNWLETGARFTMKQGTEPMELADMFSRDLYEWVRGDCHGKPPRRWRLFSEKTYRRGDMGMGKFGVKVFPDSDIREHIERHRQECDGY